MWNAQMGAMMGTPLPFPMGMGARPTTTNNHKWGSKEDNQQLSLELRQFGAYVSEVDEQSRPVIDHMITLLQEAVTNACPGAVLESYGSYATGLWLPSSDVDMVVHLPRRDPGMQEKNWGKGRGKEKDAGSAGAGAAGDGSTSTAAAAEDDHTPEMILREAFAAFKNIAAALEEQPWTADVKPITSSKMPVIKLKVCHAPGRGAVYGIPFDITVDPGFATVVEGRPDLAVHSGVPVKCMVKYCLTCMPGLQTLTLVLKQYLRECGLNDTYYGGVSSYTIFLMLVRYLQDHFPPLFAGQEFKKIAKREGWAKHIQGFTAEKDGASSLKSEGYGGEEKGASTTSTTSTSTTSTTTSSSTSPSLQVNAPAFATTTRWRHLTSKLMKSSKRKPILGELLMEFLYLFGENFDYATMGFSILHGGRYFNVKEERHVGSPMWIDDPMRPGTNIAGSHFKISAVASAFRDAFLMLNRHVPNPYYPTRLSRLIRANPWLQQFVYEATARELLRIQSLHDSTQQIAANAHTHVLRDARPKMHTTQGTIPPPPKGYGSARKKAAKEERRHKRKKGKRQTLKSKSKKASRKEAANSASDSASADGKAKSNGKGNKVKGKGKSSNKNKGLSSAGKNLKRTATRSNSPQEAAPNKTTKESGNVSSTVGK